MPRSSQIVPQYKFPYVETYYNDNTGYTDDTVEEVQEGFRSLCVFASPRGRDNVILTKGSVSAFTEEYGNVDFKTYGQAALNAYTMLESGQALVHCMRVMPADANLANAIIVAKVKVGTTQGTPNFVSVPKAFKVTTEDGTTESLLSWEAVTDATGYEVLINNDTNAIVSVTGTEYNHTGLVAANQVTYKVRALTATGTSAWSNECAITVGTAAEITAEDTADPTEVNDKLIIKHEMYSVDTMKKEADIETYMEELANDDSVDDDGFRTIPLFAVFSLGRGTYGNFYRIRLVADRTQSEDMETMVYRLEVYDTTTGLTLKKSHSVTLNPDDVINKKSYFLPDIVNDESTAIGAVGNEEAISTIFDMYKEAFPESTVEIEDFDIIEGLTIANKAIDNLSIYIPDEDDDAETAISLSRSEGCALAYGSDGSMAPTNKSLDDVINKCYIDAFNGELNSGIKSKRKYPTEVILDANYSLEAKLALVALGLKRGDCQVVLDAGIIDTVKEATTWGASDEIASIDDWHISKTFQHATIKDPFTNRNIVVTATYFYAQLLPNHYFTVGRNMPMTGKDYGLITGIVRGKIAPYVEYDDTDVKTSLYDARLNYIEGVAESTFVIGTQSTSQVKKSDMLEMHNAAIILYLKKKLEDMCINVTYRFSEESDRASYTETGNKMLSEYESWYRSASVYFDKSAYEEERSILHCYLSIVLKGITKNCIIEIDINKRTS